MRKILMLISVTYGFMEAYRLWKCGYHLFRLIGVLVVVILTAKLRLKMKLLVVNQKSIA